MASASVALAANRREDRERAIIAQALNFASGDAPSTIQLLTAGRVEGRDGRYWQNSDPDGIVAAFERHDGLLVIDYEHATEFNWDNQPAPAAGWITRVVNRNGEIWADVEWTEKAETMIKAREYRFISPVFYYHVETLQILELVSAGLTNQPNLKLAALNKRGQTPRSKQEGNDPMDREQYLALCAALGLNPDASVESVMTAVSANKRAATPDLDKFVPRAEFDAMQERAENAERRIEEEAGKAVNAKIEASVDQAIADKKILPSERDFYLASCKAEGGLDRFEAFVKDRKPHPLAANSQLDDTKPAGAAGVLTADEKALCKQMGVSEEDYLKTRDNG